MTTAKSSARKCWASFESQIPGQLHRAVINRCADLNEATKRRTTVWDVNSKGVAAQDINALSEELLFD